MSARPGSPQSDAAVPPESQSVAPRKPRLALFVATACGLGYIPVAPGTFGSLAGLALPILPIWIPLVFIVPPRELWDSIFARHESWIWDISAPQSLIDPVLAIQCALTLVVGTAGVVCAGRAARFWSAKDPQRVVIDEVSGQHLTLLIGCAVPIWWKAAPRWWNLPLGLITSNTALSWKYLLVGLILFRLFDIWKPFPVRQAESLPGGWGIMADDWVAALYAGIGLWIARAAGL